MICYNPTRLAREQVGRSLLRLRVKERKVRTLQGSEPVNGGALEPDVILGVMQFCIASSVKEARATTSATEKRPASGQPCVLSGTKGRLRVMGETVRPLAGLKVRAH